MFNFVDYADYYNKLRPLLPLAMCKAFNSLNWKFIFKAFECNEFGDNFIRCLKTVYNTSKCSVINNN